MISHKRIPVGLESDNWDIIFTFLLQMDPTTDPTNGNETFVPQTNRYVHLTESVYITFNGLRLHYIQRTPLTTIHIVSHLWDSVFFKWTIFAHRETLPKICTMSKISLNKSFSELNFVQKSQWAHISISHRSRDRGYKNCHFRFIEVLFMLILSYNMSYDIYHFLLARLRLPKKFATLDTCLALLTGKNSPAQRRR